MGYNGTPEQLLEARKARRELHLWDYLDTHPGGQQARKALLTSLAAELSAPDVGFTAEHFMDPGTRPRDAAPALAADRLAGAAGGAGGHVPGFMQADAGLDARMRAMLRAQRPRRVHHPRMPAFHAAPAPPPRPPPPLVQVELRRVPKAAARKKEKEGGGAAKAAAHDACGGCEVALPPLSLAVVHMQPGGAGAAIVDPISGGVMHVDHTARSAYC
jgi:hypothetical protein